MVYRATALPYATSRDLVTGIGAKNIGGRWNPRGEFAAVYGSVDPETALAESLAQHRRYGFSVHIALPLVVAAIEVRLARVLDVSGADVQAALSVDATSLAAIDWRREVEEGREPATHVLGRGLYQAGWEAIVVPSATRAGAVNLTVFPGNLGPKSMCVGVGIDTRGA